MISFLLGAISLFPSAGVTANGFLWVFALPVRHWLLHGKSPAIAGLFP